MKQKLSEYILLGVVAVWIIAFFWIMSASSQCSQTAALGETNGICLARRLSELSCILGVELAFGWAAGRQARARNYPFIMGFLLGFFLSALGGILVMTLSPRPPGGAGGLRNR